MSILKKIKKSQKNVSVRFQTMKPKSQRLRHITKNHYFPQLR